jgi:hypothetical protein
MSTLAPEVSQSPTRAADAAQPAAAGLPPFGVNEMRLDWRQWLAVFAIVVTCAVALPRLWKKVEPYPTGGDYRIPYALSTDYWLYERRLGQLTDPHQVPVLGDSVVWGEYVRPDGTLSHFLNANVPTGAPAGGVRFVNCGVNGMFPLALEGLLRDYGAALHDRKVILQCNLLWMSSPRADLSDDKEQTFNHARLVPQFSVCIPCYRADAHERISAVLERHVGYFAWTNHLQDAYYDQRSLPQWTLEEDPRHPRHYPNAYRNPAAPLAKGIPVEPENDPDRGPASRRHKPWNVGGAEPVEFEWVDLDKSLQWQAFQRLVQLLKERGNDVLVVLGPFNEHMVAESQRPQYRATRDRAAAWLRQSGVTLVVPEVLPSEMYADASHPLTQGYALLAQRIAGEEAFRRWVAQAGGR